MWESVFRTGCLGACKNRGEVKRGAAASARDFKFFRWFHRGMCPRPQRPAHDAHSPQEKAVEDEALRGESALSRDSWLMSESDKGENV